MWLNRARVGSITIDRERRTGRGLSCGPVGPHSNRVGRCHAEPLEAEELAVAVRGVLTAQGQLPMDALVTEVARLFGYSRVREPARTRLRLVAQQSLGPEESA